MNLGLNLTVYTKINFKCYALKSKKDKTLKLLNKHRRKILGTCEQGKNSETWHQRHHSWKEKNDKFDFIEMKNPCSANDPGREWEDKSTAWEELFKAPYLTKDLYLE